MDSVESLIMSVGAAVAILSVVIGVAILTPQINKSTQADTTAERDK